MDDFVKPWKTLNSKGTDRVAVVWELKVLKALGESMMDFIRSAVSKMQIM